MKKNEMKKLALLGLTAGTLWINQSGLQALYDENSIDLEHVIAKPGCKAHGGCGGLTASRDLNSTTIQNDEDLDDDEDFSESENEDSSNHKNLKELV